MYYVLAYYSFKKIADPQAEVLLHKEYLGKKDATSRIYISEQGINGQMSAEANDALAYIDWMHSRPEFAHVEFKIHEWHEQAFPRLTIKYRKKLVGIDVEVDMDDCGEHVSPEQWKEMLDASEERVLVDVRNDYEWKVGHFEGAELPPCETFREFSAYADDLKQRVDPKKTPVMMYCTGGIRCEIYSSLLKKEGFEKVYQLQGGIIKYGLEAGSKHWNGKLFVFDDRLTVPISKEETKVVGKCHHCGTAVDNYYNCANMDCNILFICCQECLEKHVGCCQESCCQSDKLRPFNQQKPHKPFRRKHNFFTKK